MVQAKRSLYSLSQKSTGKYNWQLSSCKSQLLPYFSAVFHLYFTQNSKWTSSFCNVHSPAADPFLAALTDVSKDAGFQGIKSSEMPNLNSPLHLVTGRSNCNRKAIITYSSSGRRRFYAQQFFLIAADYSQQTNIYFSFTFTTLKDSAHSCLPQVPMGGKKKSILVSDLNNTFSTKLYCKVTATCSH